MSCFGSKLLDRREERAGRLMHSEVLRTDQGKLAYYHWPAEGPSLLLIPGSWDDHRQFDEIRLLLDPQINLVIVELPGHGHSWPPAREGSIEGFALDVLRVADTLGWEAWYAGGHSIGGMIAIELAGRRPGQIQGVISIEGWTHHRVLDEAFAGNVYGTLTSEQEKRRQRARSQGRSRLTDQQRSDFASIWTRWNGEPTLNTTDVKVLELWGDRNKSPPSRRQMRIPARANIQLRWIAGASHALPLERPHEVAAEINRFLQDGA